MMPARPSVAKASPQESQKKKLEIRRAATTWTRKQIIQPVTRNASEKNLGLPRDRRKMDRIPRAWP